MSQLDGGSAVPAGHPDIALVEILLQVVLADHVGYPLAVRGNPGIAYVFERELVVDRDRPAAGLLTGEWSGELWNEKEERGAEPLDYVHPGKLPEPSFGGRWGTVTVAPEIRPETRRITEPTSA